MALSAVSSPDGHADGLLQSRPDPLRYDHHTTDSTEVGGMVAAFIPHGARVLDIGCGSGTLATLLMDARGVEVVGIEPDSERAGAARARGLEVHQGLFEDAELSRLGAFDAVLLADVLEHLPDPAATLRRVHVVLKPDGVVVASVPNVPHWSVRWNLLRGRFDYEPCGIMDATHLRWFTERSVRALFVASGYEVEAVGQTLGAWLPPYTRGWPWRLLPAPYSRRLLMSLTRAMPALFGCQHVVRARRVIDGQLPLRAGDTDAGEPRPDAIRVKGPP